MRVAVVAKIAMLSLARCYASESALGQLAAKPRPALACKVTGTETPPASRTVSQSTCPAGGGLCVPFVGEDRAFRIEWGWGRRKRPPAGPGADSGLMEQSEGWLSGTLDAWDGERLLLSVAEKDGLMGQLSIRRNTSCVYF